MREVFMTRRPVQREVRSSAASVFWKFAAAAAFEAASAGYELSLFHFNLKLGLKAFQWIFKLHFDQLSRSEFQLLGDFSKF